MCMPAFARPLGLLLGRVALASVFVYHGWMKLGFWMSPLPEGMPEYLFWLMRLLFVVEVVGGVAVLVGAWTHWAAKVLGIVMVGAIGFKVAGVFGQVVPFSSPQGLGWEFDFVLLGLAAVLMVSGAGAWSVDAHLCGDKPAKKKK